MSEKIKPQQGVTYECYKGFTDQYNDRCRSGQKFKWSTEHDEHEFTGYYVMEKASGRGVNIAVPVNEFQSYFIPVDTEGYILDINEPQQSINQFDLKAMLISAIKAFEKQMQEQHPEYFVTHKVGNRYKHTDGNRYLLVGGRVSNQVVLVNLKTGKVESYKVAVEDTDNITAGEFSELCFDSSELTLIKERQ
jgi:hypothetical protein